MNGRCEEGVDEPLKLTSYVRYGLTKWKCGCLSPFLIVFSFIGAKPSQSSIDNSY